MTRINDRLRRIWPRIAGTIKNNEPVILMLALVIMLALIILALYLHVVKGWVWADWIGINPYTDAEGKLQRGKTLWDWLELLIIPAVLGLGALFFNRQERQNEWKVADQRNQESVLQNYFDKINDLILDRHLLDVKRCREEAITEENPHPTEEEMEERLSPELRAVRDMAQVRTVTVLRQLNRDRRDTIFQFLRDTDLASFILVSASLGQVDWPNINMNYINMSKAHLQEANLSESDLFEANLSGARLSFSDLRKVYLSRANLFGANLIKTNLIEADLTEANLMEANLIGAILRGADLMEANLIGANLRGADLREANLNGANLRGADLRKADLGRSDLGRVDFGEIHLSGADLSGADLREANLRKANLSGANLREAKVLDEQLATVRDITGATMPDGKKFDPAIHTFWKEPFDIKRRNNP